MAEKEASYETARGGQQDQKPSATVLHLPGLTSKPTRAHNNKQQEAEGRTGKDADAPSGPSGYYMNVAQKGKLILPTALWILLILAGIAFLGLLASLSRTIDTLDTLVELEQEKEARASISEHLARHAHLHSAGLRAEHKKQHSKHAMPTTRRPLTSRDESLRRHDDLEFSDGASGWMPLGGDLLPVPLPPTGLTSWLSLPSWTSLEPVRSSQVPRHPDEVKMMPMPDGVTIEIAGNGGGGGDGGMPPAGLISSIMSQVVPMLDSFMGPPPPPPPPASPARLGMGMGMGPHVQRVPDSDDLGAMISAKIDNLNINLNAANSEQQKSKAAASTREEEIKSLESSVDDLVAKLMAQKMSRGSELAVEPLASGAHHHRHHQHGPKVDEIMPTIRLPPPPPPHAHHNLVRPGPPMSPLASLLMGPGGRPMGPAAGDDSSAMIIGPFNSPADLESMLAGAGVGQAVRFPPLDDAQVVISVGSEQAPLVSGEINRHGMSNTERPLFSGSPYELSQMSSPLMPLLDSFKDLNEMMKKADSQATNKPARKSEGEAKWDMLSNDLADALLQGALGDQQQKQPASGPLESVVMVNGKQLEGGERDKFLNSIFGPSGGASETKSPLSDMMNLMLHEPMRTTVKTATDETLKVQTTPAPAVPSVVTLATLEPTLSTANKINQSAGTTAATTSATGLVNDADVSSPAADMVNDLLSTMFALPQFSGSQQQTSTGGSSSSGSPSASSGSSSSSSVTRPLESNSSSSSTSTTEASYVPITVTQSPSMVFETTTTDGGPASSMLSTIMEALHTPHLESEIAKDSLLRDFLGVSTPREDTTTPQPVITMTTTTTPTTTTAGTTVHLATPKTTASPAPARQPSAQVIREEDAPSNMPILDLGPYARSTSPSIETLKESYPPTTPTPTTSPAPVSDVNVVSSAAIPTTTTSPTGTASTLGVVNSLQNSTTGTVGGNNSTTMQPLKSFLQKADDFIERNLMNFKRFF